MNVLFLKPAQFEVDDTVAWYNTQSQGLGMQFLDDIDRTIRRIVAYPLSSVEIEQGASPLLAFTISLWNYLWY